MKRKSDRKQGKGKKGESVAERKIRKYWYGVRSRRGTGRLIANVNVNVKSSGGFTAGRTRYGNKREL